MSEHDQSIGQFRRRQTAPRAAVAMRAPGRPVESAGEYLHPLSQLVIGSDAMRDWSPFQDQCPVEMMDATYEDENGRLPHEPGYVGKHAAPAPAVLHALTDAQTAISEQESFDPDARPLDKRSKVTAIELRALYADHLGGASVFALGKRLADQGRYSNASNAAQALRSGWKRLGLPYGFALDAEQSAA